MDPELKWLMDQSGLSDTELKSYEALLGDAKFKQMLIKLKAAGEQAATDKTTAETERLNLEKKLNDEIYPEVRKVTQDSVRAAGELAKAKAELEAARQYGIVPASVEEVRAPGSPAAAAPTVDTSQYVSKSDFDRLRNDSGRAALQIGEIQAEHFKLTGEPLTNLSEIYTDLERERTLGHNDATLRTVWERKYEIPQKREAKAAAETQKKMDEYAQGKVKEYAEKHTDGSPQKIARESRFSTYKPGDGASGDKPWQRSHQKKAANEPWRQSAAAKVEKALVH